MTDAERLLLLLCADALIAMSDGRFPPGAAKLADARHALDAEVFQLAALRGEPDDAVLARARAALGTAA